MLKRFRTGNDLDSMNTGRRAPSRGRLLLGGVLALALGAGSVPLTRQNPPQPQRGNSYAPDSTPSDLGLAGYAKVLCSAVFVSGRDPEEAFRNSGFFLMPERDRPNVTKKVIDREKKLVSLSLSNGLSRTAKFHGDQGCIIQQMDGRDIFFKPVPVKTTLPDASTTPWPMGDAESAEPISPEVDQARMKAAVDLAFADPNALTAGMVIMYKGRIVAERYMPGITKDTQLESWSMGKSITSTLIGVLVQQGALKIGDPAPVPLWRKPGDPRGAIRTIDLLHMSSGLKFSGGADPEEYPDHMRIYTGAIDVFDYSITRPVEYPPNTVGRYRNCDPLTLGYIVQQLVRQRGEEYLTFPQRALFDKIGIRRQVLETDPYGNLVMTGFDYGTPRNWARIGLLYLQDGMFNGQRVLPAGWAKFVSTPAPAWKERVYGGQFWVNGTGEWNLPMDAFFAAGGGGQYTFIVPSYDLVIVRMGHFRGVSAAAKTLRAAQSEIIASIRRKS